MSIDDFREYMGVRPDEYADFRRLGQWVIYGPCKAINGSPVADITVEPKIDRDGRKAVGISFAVEPKPQALVPFIEAEKEPLPAFRLTKVPILAEAQAKYLALRSAEEIALCIERANQYGEKQAKDGKPPNYGALYHTAIKEGWHFALADKKATEESALAQKKARATAKRQEAAERKAQAEKGLAESEAVLGRFKSLPEAPGRDHRRLPRQRPQRPRRIQAQGLRLPAVPVPLRALPQRAIRLAVLDRRLSRSPRACRMVSGDRGGKRWALERKTSECRAVESETCSYRFQLPPRHHFALRAACAVPARLEPLRDSSLADD